MSAGIRRAGKVQGSVEFYTVLRAKTAIERCHIGVVVIDAGEGLADLAAGENLAEAETLLKKALTIAPGREDFRFMLAQVYIKGKRTADGMALLTTLQRVTTIPDLKQKTIALLDELTPAQAIFTEIRPEDIPAPKQAKEPANLRQGGTSTTSPGGRGGPAGDVVPQDEQNLLGGWDTGAAGLGAC